MAYKQIKDILNRAVEFHAMLIDFFSRIEKETDKETVKILVNYMARHEEVLKDRLSKITEAQESAISEEWLKYEPEFATCTCFEDLNINKDSGVDEVINASLKLNQCLVDLYHQMTEIAPTHEIKELFESLEISEVAEKKKLANMRGM